MAPRRIWIMDGHNMIFAIRPLRELQVADRREEARAGLAEELERFAIARGEKVLIVFDGNQQPSSQGTVRKPLLETAYSGGGEGAADERIIREATRCLEQGMGVTVVTNDVSTLARMLPRGVRHLGVEEFWLKHIEKEPGEGSPGIEGDRRIGGGQRIEGGKRVEGDFSDVEREMLVRAAAMDPVFEVRERARPAARTGDGAAAPSAPGALPRAVGEDAARELMRLKRERGRLRQERRLKRRAKSAPRR